ncbi:MAG: flagellar motor switch protein FliN [Gemmatimonadetes bacterium]|jgi:flagellar motor switch protein FliN|nr:flagellar motor switch protein FliN [Gemmatimonadota bacterium]
MAAKQSGEKVNRVQFPVLKKEDKAPPKKGNEVVPADLGALAGLQDVEVKITLEWGRTEITVEEAMQLDKEALLRLDHQAKEPIDVRVNGKLFGRGVLVMVGETYGVQLTEIVDSE